MTIKWTSVLALLGALVIGGVPTDARATLLNNGGFEDPLGFDFSDTSNWNGFFGAPAGTILEAFNDTGAPANSGAQALELTIEGVAGVTNGENSFTGHTQTVSGISEGDELRLTGFARNNNSALTGNIEFRIEFADASGAEISRAQIVLDGLLTDEYQEFSVTGIAPAGTVSARPTLAIATFNDPTVVHDHSVLFDDISLVNTAIPEPTTLAMLGLGGLACGVRTRRNRV